ncbi:hypothetical protein [Pseudomonas sp. NFACC07-1]|uniref:hypothetical protein n=1 Tax=Pseudomonas sp. NFACC07-1 TaxID=1566239 RepID=UPI0008AC8C26|nr:hypothetical protein [Pseudomonas sp. NFACC07-1]SEJ84322.1 hypothetical protein SAMN03159298_04657 [Pseudomonas sp. NFACC07-1]
MSLALRNAEIFTFDSFFNKQTEERFTNENIKKKSIFDGAAATCLELVKNSSVAEPHFCWESIGSAVLMPSDYQFTRHLDFESDLVTIEDDEIPLRGFCLEALDVINGYRDLSDGWDGDDAIGPSHPCLDDAYTFLRLVSTNVEHCPTIVPMLDPEGIPSLAFDNGTNYLAIAFYGNNSVVSYFINRETNQSNSNTFFLDEDNKLAELMSIIEAL